jgi:hypothetical protein
MSLTHDRRITIHYAHTIPIPAIPIPASATHQDACQAIHNQVTQFLQWHQTIRGPIFIVRGEFDSLYQLVYIWLFKGIDDRGARIRSNLHAIIPMRANEVPLLADALEEDEIAKLALTDAVSKEGIHQFLMRKLQASEASDTIVKQYQDHFEEATARLETKRQQNKAEWMKFKQKVDEFRGFLNSSL